MTVGSGGKSSLRVWLPAVRAGSGADVFTERLATALDRAGIAATISWFPHWTELAPDVLRLVKPPVGTNIIHANSANAFAFKRDRIPLVVTEHHYVLDPAYRPYKTFAQHLYHRALVGAYLRHSYGVADAVTTDSAFTAGVLKQVVGVEATEVIPLWADYAEFSPASEAPESRQGEPFTLLFVGNDSLRKGADVIPVLAARLGDGFEILCTSGLRQRAKSEAPANVRVLGRLDRAQLVRAYRDCDAVLVPSRYEGFGYSALEAMACAKPVVGFRCGAIKEVVADGETALLCDIDDVDALEANCRRLSQDAMRSRELGAAGRARATSVFTEAKAIAAYIPLYESLL